MFERTHEQSSPLVEMLSTVPFPGGATRTVVVLVPDPSTDVSLDASPWAPARVVTCAEVPTAAIGERLRALDRVDVVVDLRSSIGGAQLEAWRELFFHVHQGGTWVARRTPQVPEDRRERLVERLAELAEARSPKSLAPRWRELARSAGEITVVPGLARVDKRLSHLLKVRDEPALALLSAREPELSTSEIVRVEGGVLHPAGRTTQHEGAPDRDLPAELPFPAVQARRYEGRIHLHSGAFAHHGRSLLPESFRWHLSEHPVNESLVDVGAHFARLKRAEPTGELLDGSFYYFDYRNTGHYGHLMTEAAARLWAWDAAKAADPGLKILLRRHDRRSKPVSERPEMTLLPAYGIDPDDIVWFAGSVDVESLVGCTPQWHNAVPHYVHPDIRDVWRRLREGVLTERRSAAPFIFVSRAEGNRPCRNVEAVNSVFTQHGFTVIHPGGLTIAEQAATFAGARVVAGFGGTGMFNMVFAEQLEAVVVLNHSAYDARNEHLFASVLGADSHFFWSKPDLEHPADGFSYEAFQSAWEFDLERNGAQLRETLRSLVQ